MATATPTPVPDDALYEVVDGQVVEKPNKGAYSGWVASRFQNALGPWVWERRLGRVVREMLFRLGRSQDLQRRPDVAFVSSERWPLDRQVPDEEAWDVVPDLAIDVVSRASSAIEVHTRMHEYFKAGVRLVWVIYPKAGELYAYDAPTSVRILGRHDMLDAEPLLPGFQLPLASVFAAPAE